MEKARTDGEVTPKQAVALDSGHPQTSCENFWSMVQWLKRWNSKEKVGEQKRGEKNA